MTTEFAVAPAADSYRQEFAELSRRVRDEGLLGRRRAHYTVKISLSVLALVALGTTLVVVGDSWWCVAIAIGLGLVMTQLGFIGHDAGHRQISSSRRDNDAIGLVVANLFTGFSFGWWVTKHNRHHAYTNRPEKDPDLVPGAIVYLPEQADERGPFGQWFARFQSLMLIPLLFLEALNLHVASVISLSKRRDGRVILESALLSVHLFVFFVAPFFILSPVKAVVFILVTQAILGFYLGVSFITNHVGMPVLTGEDELGFLRRQVLTSRNLSGRPWTGFLFGGLDTQIEHHLFPAMPRANLRRARTLVGPFCAEKRIEYTLESPWQAYCGVLRHLQVVGLGVVRPIVG